MTLRNTLNRLIRAVIDEADRNPDFAAALNDALEVTKRRSNKDDDELRRERSSEPGGVARSKNRRTSAVLDPVQIVRQGEPALREALGKLSLDQLRDVVAEYGMDTGRVVMKWVAPDRVLDRIVEIAIKRAHKGDAFRKPPEGGQASIPSDFDVTERSTAVPSDEPPETR